MGSHVSSDSNHSDTSTRPTNNTLHLTQQKPRLQLPESEMEFDKAWKEIYEKRIQPLVQYIKKYDKVEQNTLDMLTEYTQLALVSLIDKYTPSFRAKRSLQNKFLNVLKQYCTERNCNNISSECVAKFIHSISIEWQMYNQLLSSVYSSNYLLLRKKKFVDKAYNLFYDNYLVHFKDDLFSGFVYIKEQNAKSNHTQYFIQILHTFIELLHEQFIKKTDEHYNMESNVWMMEPLSEYIRKVIKCMNSYSTSNKCVINLSAMISFKTDLLTTLDQQLVLNYLDKLLNDKENGLQFIFFKIVSTKNNTQYFNKLNIFCDLDDVRTILQLKPKLIQYSLDSFITDYVHAFGKYTDQHISYLIFGFIRIHSTMKMYQYIPYDIISLCVNYFGHTVESLEHISKTFKKSKIYNIDGVIHNVLDKYDKATAKAWAQYIHRFILLKKNEKPIDLIGALKPIFFVYEAANNRQLYLKQYKKLLAERILNDQYENMEDEIKIMSKLTGEIDKFKCLGIVNAIVSSSVLG